MPDPNAHASLQVPGVDTRLPTVDTRRAELQAVAALADVAGQQTESILAATALGHSEPAFREEAIHALGERRGSISLQTLQLALQDPSPRIRAAAIRAFVEIGGDSAALELSAALSATDPALRLSAVDALGQIGGTEAARYLHQVLLDESAVVREAAHQWLAELCDERSQGACTGSEAFGWWW